VNMQAHSSSRRECARVMPTPFAKHRRFRSSSDSSGGGGRFVTIVAAKIVARMERSVIRVDSPARMPLPDFASLHPGYEEIKKEAGRRKALLRNHRIVRCGAAPAGAARLPAFHHGSHLRDCSSRRLSIRPGFVGGGAVWGELPSPRRSHFQRCTSRAGHSAGRLMPELPGSEGDEPTARGHRTRSAEPASPAGVLHGSEIRCSLVTEIVTIVNGRGTVALGHSARDRYSSRLAGRRQRRHGQAMMLGVCGLLRNEKRYPLKTLSR
jgi:hypothetical protein